MNKRHGALRLVVGASLVAMLVVSGGVAMAQPPPERVCFAQTPTLTGTGADDTITGTEGNDVIIGLRGDDVVNAGAGNDRVCGYAGNDVLVGGAGNDQLRGNDGNDVLITVDSVEGNDVAIGGPGNDTCVIDPGDFTFSCENIVEVTPEA